MDDKINFLDNLIAKRDKYFKLTESDAYNFLVNDIKQLFLNALEDYLKDNSQKNQAYVNFCNDLLNFLQNLPKVNETELKSAISRKEVMENSLKVEEDIRDAQSSYSGGDL